MGIFCSARLGTILALFLSSSFLSLSLVCLSGFRGVKLLVRCGTGTFRLVVRLWVVGCPPAVSRPKVGGLGWLAVRACGLGYSVDLLFRWLFAPGGLLMQSTYFTADCLCLSACCSSASVFSVSWFVSLFLFRSCVFSELSCQPADLQLLCFQ